MVVGALTPPATVDIDAMARCAYDITHYQPVLFAADSFDHAVDVLSGFFDSYDDDEFARLNGGSIEAAE